MEKLDLVIVILAILLSVALLCSGFGSALATGSWGLSFPSPGQSPAAPATPEALGQWDAAYLGSTQEQVIYLTFDAGYENGYTASILDTLKAHQVPATFFLVGNYLEQNPDLVRRMVSEGHTVGNHTMHHPDMSKITDRDTFNRELQDLEALYTQVTGQTMSRYYRPPQGIYSQDNLSMAQELGYHTVFWSLAYADWDNQNQPSHDTAMEKLTSRIHNGAVVLLHATSQTNAEILDELLTAWESMGYRFAPIDELFTQST